MNDVYRYAENSPSLTTLAKRYGDMPAHRIRLDRYPATEADAAELDAHTDRLYELVDGVLIEKTYGFIDAVLSASIGSHLLNFARTGNLGVVTGASGTMRLKPGLVRIPDVAFTRYSQLPNRKVPKEPIPDLHPDLAVEILNPANSREEMDEKLIDYFATGTNLVWFVDPATKTVTVFERLDRATAKDAFDQRFTRWRLGTSRVSIADRDIIR